MDLGLAKRTALVWPPAAAWLRHRPSPPLGLQLLICSRDAERSAAAAVVLLTNGVSCHPVADLTAEAAANSYAKPLSSNLANSTS